MYMRPIYRSTLTALVLFTPVCFAQKWEVGGAGGGGFYRNLTVSNAIGNATTGFHPGFAFSGFIRENMYRFVSGELRYTYCGGDLKVSRGGTDVSFKAVAHAIHYDFILEPKTRLSRLHPFTAAGAGVKVFRGIGQEAAYQPLNNFALLTKTHETKPLLSVGGGTKFALAPRTILRVEFRDYITPFPKNVIAPAPGARLSGWLHDFVPLVGISFLL